MNLEERMQWAAIAAIIGALHDGPELCTERRVFQRLEAACRSFCVPEHHFDEVAEKLGYYYVRNGDYYASKDHLAEQLATRH